MFDDELLANTVVYVSLIGDTPAAIGRYELIIIIILKIYYFLRETGWKDY